MVSGWKKSFARHLKAIHLVTQMCDVSGEVSILRKSAVQQSFVNLLTSSVFTFRLVVRSSPWWHLHLSPSNDVLDHTNHIFSESLSSGDDNDRDEDLQKDKYKDKDTQTQTKTNTKCFQDPMYAISIKTRGFKDLKYCIGCLLVMTKTKTKTKTQFYK